MTIKTILTEPNKILRQISQPVAEVNDEVKKLMNDMLETMYSAQGIGLAAIQIGVPKRVIVMDLSKKDEKKEPRYFVNPIVKNTNIDLADWVTMFIIAKSSVGGFGPTIGMTVRWVSNKEGALWNQWSEMSIHTFEV